MSGEKFGWVWQCKRSNICGGPFTKREDAVLDAEESEREVDIGHAVYPVPADYVTGDVERVIELADETADGAGVYIGDGFELCGSLDDAQAALDAALKAWAREWLCSTSWSFEEGES